VVRPSGAGPAVVRALPRWHLAENVRAAVAEDLADLDPRQVPRAGKLAGARTHSVYLAAPKAFDTPSTWRAFDDLARLELDYASLRILGEDGPLCRTRRWLKENELLVLTQQARRPDRFGPEATGALEAEIHSIRGTLHRRAQTLRNQARTDLLLRLSVAARRGQADERLWAEKVRTHLEALRLSELERYNARLAGFTPEQREVVEALTRQLVAKVAHEPTVRLKDAAGSPKGQRMADALRSLFDL